MEFYFARNVINLGVDNNLLSFADNCKNKFLVLSEGPTNLVKVHQRKSLVFILANKYKNLFEFAK